MKMLRVAGVLLLCCVALSHALGQNQSVESLVASGAPTQPLSKHPGNLRSCNAVFSTYPSGSPSFIVAGYSDGYAGMLRMLSVDQAATQVTSVAELSKQQYSLDGSDCDLSVIDFSTSASSNQLLSKVIQFDLYGLSGRGKSSWFFAWNGTAFVNLTPLEQSLDSDRPDTQMLMAYAADLEHGTAKQIISNGESDTDYLVWKFDGSSYVFEREITYAAQFIRDKGKPAPVLTGITPDSCDPPACLAFDIASTGPQYKLTLVNGLTGGQNRVSSAWVLINNQTVVSPSDLNQQVEFVTKTVTLATSNTLYVSVDGGPGGQIYVILEPLPPQQ